MMGADFDMSWADPSEAQLAALAHVHKCLGRRMPELPDGLTHSAIVRMEYVGKCLAVDTGHTYKLSEYDLAEMMCLADKSLWLSEARRWAGVTPKVDTPESKAAASVFTSAGDTVTRVVELGFSDGVWWNLAKLWEAREIADRMVKLLVLATGRHSSSCWPYIPMLMLPGLSTRKLYGYIASGGDGFAMATSEIRAHYDADFRKAWNAAKRVAKATVQSTYEPARCIKPGCACAVAPSGIEPRDGHARNWRGTGACCKEHANYWCGKCEKIHSYRTGIGQQHTKHASGAPQQASTVASTAQPGGAS